MDIPELDRIETLFLSLVVEYKMCGLSLDAVSDKYISFSLIFPARDGKVSEWRLILAELLVVAFGRL